MQIPQITADGTSNLAVEAINKGKQAIVFVNSKRSAESQADKISKLIKIESQMSLSEQIIKALDNPTKQCERLSKNVIKGIAFHHAGLPHKQRELVEEGFRNGNISVICATPTLAQGLDLPAYRVIIRDLKRFGRRGMTGIMVLEYEQMAGRAGRPGKEKEGEAIAIAKTEREQHAISETYVYGEPENIYSKLGVEPVLRIYVLSLVSSGFVADEKELLEFMENTFYASQFGDMPQLRGIINKVILELKDWKFLQSTDNDFVTATEYGQEKLKATLLGNKVAELYLDPLTAHQIIQQFNEAKKYEKPANFSILFMISSTLELRPLPNVRMSEYEIITETTLRYLDELFTEVPDEYDEAYEYFVKALKQTLIFYEWIEEQGEDKILERYNVRPGELSAKRDRADWLLYSAAELAKLTRNPTLVKEFTKLRKRLEYGAREELLTLLKLKNIGKVRARKLYSNGYTDLGKIKKENQNKLGLIIGKKMAENIKNQLG